MKAILLFCFSLLFLIPLYSQWEMLNGPYAATDIRLVAHHPNGNFFAVTNALELYRSVDNAITWNKISVLPIKIGHLMISPEGHLFGNIPGGYLRSTDLGITWQERILFSNAGTGDIVFKSPGYIFISEVASTNLNGIWISSDYGVTWNESTAGLNASALGSLAIDSFGSIYGISPLAEIFKSTNNGLTWQLIADLAGGGAEIEIDNNNNIFIITRVLQSYGIIKSTDLGSTWTIITTDYTYNIFIDSNNNLYASVRPYDLGKLMFSSNGGGSWINLNIPGSTIYDLVVHNNTIYVATSRCLKKTSNLGQDWIDCFRYVDRFAYSNDILILPSGKIFVASAEGLYSSHDNGINWNLFHYSPFQFVERDNAGIIYAGSDSLYRSSDEGVTWNKCGNFNRVQSIFITDSDIVLLAIKNHVLESTDHGVKFDTIGFIDPFWGDLVGITQNSSGTIFICTYRYWEGDEFHRLSKTDNNGVTWSTIRWDMHFLNLYFFNDTMYLPSDPQGLFKSSDGGYTLTPINNGFSSNNIRYIIKPRENILISLTGSGIYRSTDMGNYWSKMNHSGLTSTQINNIYYSDEGNLYACIGNGVGVFTGDLPVELISFTGNAEVNSVTLNWSTSTEINNRGFEIERSADQRNWSLIGFKNGNGTSTITHNYTFTDDLDETSNPTLYYRLKQIDFNGSFDYSQTIEVNIIPAQFSLMQGYPNPFNSTSIIKWQTPISGHVSLIVYDVLGKIAAVLVNEEKQPGIYEATFNADNLASGVYYYQLKARGFVETKKLVLIK